MQVEQRLELAPGPGRPFVPLPVRIEQDPRHEADGDGPAPESSRALENYPRRAARAVLRRDRQPRPHRVRQGIQPLDGLAVQYPREKRLGVALAARDSDEGLEQPAPGCLGVQKTARYRGVTDFGLRVEQRPRRPLVTFDQARVDVVGLEPFLHELPRLDREQLAVGEPRAQIVAQLGRRQIGQHHERRAGGGQVDEAFAQRQHGVAPDDGEFLGANA